MNELAITMSFGKGSSRTIAAIQVAAVIVGFWHVTDIKKKPILCY